MPAKKWTKEVIDDLADKLLVWIEKEDNYWLGDFCVQHNIYRGLFKQFCRDSEKFAHALPLAKQYQENKFN